MGDQKKKPKQKQTNKQTKKPITKFCLWFDDLGEDVGKRGFIRDCMLSERKILWLCISINLIDGKKRQE